LKQQGVTGLKWSRPPAGNARETGARRSTRLPESDSGERGSHCIWASFPLSNDPWSWDTFKKQGLIRAAMSPRPCTVWESKPAKPPGLCASRLRIPMKSANVGALADQLPAILQQAVPILVHVLHNENSVLRQVTCLSLGLVVRGLEKDAVVPALAETAGKRHRRGVRKAARIALNIIAPTCTTQAANSCCKPKSFAIFRPPFVHVRASRECPFYHKMRRSINWSQRRIS